VSDIKTFSNQLRSVVERYKNLTIHYKDNTPYLKGILDIPDDSGSIVGSYFIEVHYKEGFPYKFPELYEVGEDIPNDANWHKYTNSACCITVEADEVLKCKHGITVLQFISQFVIPYFANQIYRKHNGHYKNGEYSHSYMGVFEFYSALFGTNDLNKWLDYFNCAFNGRKLSIGRNDNCFCGSSIKFKNCHLKVFENLKYIGKEQVLKDFKKLS
jgi:hypothetical protein